MSLRFGDCVLDPDTRELRRNGAPVPLTLKAYELLQLLIGKRPAAVSKAQIHETLWPSTFVSGVNLSTLIFEVRQAMGDDSRRPRYVRTVRGFGYAFCAAAEEEGRMGTEGAIRRPSSCRLIWGDHEIALLQGENVLGRTPDAVAWIDHASVSRRHARVVIEGEQARLEDLGSKNGTFVGKKRIDGVVSLENGSEIRLGTVPMTFRVYTTRGTTRTTPSNSR
jgi:DNA-binding winged helix-turn-helix (wHTH) protein